MSGNAGEFVADWYGPYAADAQLDPTGPATGTQRVWRGGEAYDWYGKSRSSSRRALHPNTSPGQSYIGVRPARSWR